MQEHANRHPKLQNLAAVRISSPTKRAPRPRSTHCSSGSSPWSSCSASASSAATEHLLQQPRVHCRRLVTQLHRCAALPQRGTPTLFHAATVQGDPLKRSRRTIKERRTRCRRRRVRTRRPDPRGTDHRHRRVFERLQHAGFGDQASREAARTMAITKGAQKRPRPALPVQPEAGT